MPVAGFGSGCRTVVSFRNAGSGGAMQGSSFLTGVPEPFLNCSGGEPSVLILYFFIMGKLPDTAVSVEYQSQLQDRLFRQCVSVFTVLYLSDRLT